MRLTRATLRVLLAGFVAAACQAEPRPPATAPSPHGPPPPPPGWVGPQAAAPSARGEPCAPEGSYACAPDRVGLLACRDGRRVVVSTCRGARGCTEGTAVACDSSMAVPGDPCDEPSGVSCALDRRTLLRCINGSFQASDTCRNACLSTSGRVLCQ